MIRKINIVGCKIINEEGTKSFFFFFYVSLILMLFSCEILNTSLSVVTVVETKQSDRYKEEKNFLVKLHTTQICSTFDWGDRKQTLLHPLGTTDLSNKI